MSGWSSTNPEKHGAASRCSRPRLRSAPCCGSSWAACCWLSAPATRPPGETSRMNSTSPPSLHGSRPVRPPADWPGAFLLSPRTESSNDETLDSALLLRQLINLRLFDDDEENEA